MGKKKKKSTTNKTLYDKCRFVQCTTEIVQKSEALIKKTAELAQILEINGLQTTWQVARDFVFASKQNIDFVNVNKHGWDVMHDGRPDETKHQTIVFNDLTQKKINEYANSNGYLWFVVWTKTGEFDYALALPLNHPEFIKSLSEKLVGRKKGSRASPKFSEADLIKWGAKKMYTEKQEARSA